MELLDLIRGQHGGQIVASAALAVLVLVLRGLAARLVRQSRLGLELRRRWLVQMRTVAILVVLFGLVVIWADELRAAAFSLVAVAVAVTIAVKELLLCLSGSIVRTSSGAFSIGDRIQVGSFRGDVVDVGALSTKILEVDDATNRRTGRAVTLPNSMFLDKPAVNETFASSYVLSVLNVPLSSKVDWQEAERALLESANEECAPFLEEAKARIAQASDRLGLDAPIVEPTVSVVLDKPSEIRLLIRYPTPVRASNRVGQGILRGFLARAPKAAVPESPEEKKLEGASQGEIKEETQTPVRAELPMVEGPPPPVGSS